ncbi:ubiquinone biosynthesis O-methyltransferase, mitochondrial isoform X2 [Glossina fuscipes]|uniref:Ubiquinone biosynthesis O-methyltransferase, mitochondrial n=1 Tax=Glossina fuscipes TaxID=7396 RepID=A0A8U0WCL1_9MUSC|nr:ubiquinone biosynthesis O-methyltransferase, mitochondrial isoform X2 [Glossina fuscipes]
MHGMCTYNLNSLRSILQKQRKLPLNYGRYRVRFYNATIDNIRETASASDLPQAMSDVAKREVQHHSNLADEWWNVNGPLQALHSLNSIRVPFIRDGLVARGSIDAKAVSTTHVLENQQILEVGCGGGILTEHLARLDAKVTGIDLSDALINVAREHLKKQANARLLENITYKIEPIEIHVKDKCNFYDAVVISEVLEHIDDKVAFLTACVHSVKPGGSVFITTLNQTIPMWLGGVLVGEYVINAAPKGTHRWEQLISPLNVQRILDTMGCQTILVNGSIYEFWRNSWRWINSTSMCYALQAIKTGSF